MKRLSFSLMFLGIMQVVLNFPIIVNAQKISQNPGAQVNKNDISKTSENYSKILSKKKANYFIENKGQLVDSNGNVLKDVKFYGDINGVRYYITQTGIKYQFIQLDSTSADTSKPFKEGKIGHDCELSKKAKIHSHFVEMELVDANLSSTIIKEEAGNAIYNFYYPHCSKGILGVQGFSTIIIKDIYSKVDMKLYHYEGNIKYDFIVRPGGKQEKIKMRFKGHKAIELNSNGDLIVTNPLGILHEEAPLSYNITNGKKKTVGSKFNINKNIVTFSVNQYNINDTLIIDPTRIWGTYLGSSSWDLAHSITVDNDNNVFVGGHIFGSNIEDAQVAKLNNNGELKWITYFGRSNYSDDIYAIATGEKNSLYFTGIAKGTSTSGKVFSGKINSDNGLCIWQDSLGNSGTINKGWGIAVGKDGYIYITGQSTSSGLATSQVYKSSPDGSDAFIAKYNQSGKLKMFTYFGGTEEEISYGIALDKSNNIYIVGNTKSSLDISTSGSLQGYDDGFIAKFNNSGDTRYWSTYYGKSINGSSGIWDACRGIAIDNLDNIYVTGYLYHTSLGTTKGFLLKFTSNGDMIWENILGGLEGDHLRCISINNTNNRIYVAGFTPTIDYFVKDAYQSTFGGGIYDAIFAEYDEFGNLTFSSYYGGNGKETFDAIFCDKEGNTYIAGETSTNQSSGSIASLGAYQSTYQGGTSSGGDMMIVKFDFNKCDNNILVSQFAKVKSAVTVGNCPINSLEIQFDKNILCSSIQAGDFELTIDGQPAVIGSLTSNLLTAGATYSTIFTITLQNPITSNHNIVLRLQDEIKDICGNLLPLQDIPVEYNYSTDLEIITDNGTFCNAEKIKLCTNSSFSNYVWTKDGIILPGISTQCIEVNEPGNYSVRVNTGSCIKIATPINVN